MNADEYAGECDCGYPMIWRRGKPSCAVYGSHRHAAFDPSPPLPIVKALEPHPVIAEICGSAYTRDERRRRARLARHGRSAADKRRRRLPSTNP